jgi:peptidoglycan/LPS O-acetylase OafA/YrhL
VRRTRSDQTFAATPPPLGYRAALDGLRAVSILCVLGFHSFFLPGGGFLGVDIFFVLSGFLITNLLLAERAEAGRLNLRRFYGRRARRLLPPLLVAVAGFLAIACVEDRGGYLADLFVAVAGLTYISNILIAIDPVWVDGMRHLWSLAAEEQFYVLWPLALVGVGVLRVSRRTLMLALGVLVICMWAERIALVVAGASQRRIYFAPDTSLDPIVLGCLLALLHDGGYLERALRRDLVRRPLVMLCGGTALGMMFALPNTDPRWIYLWGLPVFGLAVSFALASIVADPASPLVPLLERPTLVALGRISYGVYLWHPILLYAAHFPPLASIPAAIVVAALSNRYVERRFRRRPRAALPTARIVATA